VFVCIIEGLLYLRFHALYRLNRKAIYNVEKDLKDKFTALRIDEHNAELKNNSAGIGFKSGVAHIDPR
jgi:tektin-1